jgi:hypothetical protein
MCPKSLPAHSLVVCLLLAALAGCESEPEFVYVLEAPQSIAIMASASATKAIAGEPIVLHVERRTAGRWQRIRNKDRAPEQCWMARIPPETEPEVADNVLWRVEPEGTARFNTDFRADHTRQLVLSMPGRFTLTASSGAWCEPGRAVAAAPIQIEILAK